MSSSDEDFFLLDNIIPKIQRKRFGIHEINKSRRNNSEYHNLFDDLKRDEQKFFQYTRMTLETFNYILGKVERRLMKTWCNWHKQPILPEERLVVTLR